MKILKKELTFTLMLTCTLFSSGAIAEKVSLTKPFICPDISPLPQKVTENGDLIIDGEKYHFRSPNAAHVSAPLTTSIWISEDGKTEVDIYQYNSGKFQQAFISFSIKVDQLPFNDEEVKKYIVSYKDSYSKRGRGCHN